MHGILCNLPEIWTTLNSKHDISDLGNVRIRESKTVLTRHKFGRGYAAVSIHGNNRKVHPWVLRKFVPCPSPMFNMCDHINRDRMDPRLINLRWSNVILNAMNKEGVRGYEYLARLKVPMYRAHLKILGMRYKFTKLDTADLARAEYEFWQRRTYEVVEALCSRNIHWKFQRMILEYWMPIKHGAVNKMKWESDSEYARLPLCGRLI